MICESKRPANVSNFLFHEGLEIKIFLSLIRRRE
jgi:hypothetical protein